MPHLRPQGLRASRAKPLPLQLDHADGLGTTGDPTVPALVLAVAEVAEARRALLAALKDACEKNDPTEIRRLARVLVGLEAPP